MKHEIIIDRKKKMLFLQIPKSASTSVKNSFKKYHPEVIEKLECYNHSGIEHFKNILQDFDEYKAYAIVRNPFFQTISWYTQTLLMARNIKSAEEHLYDEQIIKQFVQKYVIEYDIHVRQSSLITIKGKIPSNLHLFKYEDGLYSIINYMKKSHSYRLTYSYDNRCPFKHKKEKILENNFLRESIKTHLYKEFEILGYPNEYE